MHKTLGTFLFFTIIVFGASIGYATTIVWDFNPNSTTGAVGASTEAIHGSATGLSPLNPSTPLVTVSGFDVNNSAHNLYWKVAGADEHGLGFTGTLDNELTLNGTGTAIANYMQIDVSAVLAAGGTNPMIRIQSVTSGEAFNVYGGSSANSLSHLLISGSTVDNTFISIPLDSGHYDNFYFVTVDPLGTGHASDNVLLDAVEFTTVPEPSSFFLLVFGGAGVLMISRRRKAKKQICLL